MIRRAPRQQHFTVLHNDTCEDDALSWESLGLLSFLLTKPDDWTVNVQHLVSCRSAGRHKIRRILSELEDTGYLVRKRTKDEDGKFQWESVVHDTRQEDIEQDNADAPAPEEGSADAPEKNPGDPDADADREHDPEADLPPHAPTLQQVIEYGTGRAGVSKDECEKFFFHYAAVDFLDGQGRKLKWKYKLANWKKNQSRYGSSRPDDRGGDRDAEHDAETGGESGSYSGVGFGTD